MSQDFFNYDFIKVSLDKISNLAWENWNQKYKIFYDRENLENIDINYLELYR